MLVLTVQIGNEIVIDNKIRVKVLRTTATFAKLGIEAPREISVHRDTVQERINNGERRKTNPR